MRTRFYDIPRVLEDDPKVAVVLADIGAGSTCPGTNGSSTSASASS